MTTDTQAAPSQFGASLRRLREAAGMTRMLLANQSGVCYHTIVHLECGRYEPRLASALSIAHALGVSLDEMAAPDYPRPEFDGLVAVLKALAAATQEQLASYPGWEPHPDSPLGKALAIIATHRNRRNGREAG